MRRPVKPFVTEYKPTGRRGKEGRPDSELEEARPKISEAAPQPTEPGGKAAGKMTGKAASRTAARGPSNRATEEGRASPSQRGTFRGKGDSEPIDSYEAALRAADALFAPKSKSEAAKIETPASEADPAPEQVAVPSGGDEAAVTANAPAEPVGRVLRALDETEPVAAEPAPKRRGRKPGSLNRPKPSIGRSRGDAHGGAAGIAALRQTEPDAIGDDEDFPSSSATDRPVAAGMMDGTRPDADGGPHSSPDAAAGEPSAGVMLLARQRDRFSWVRTKLRPGEKWKRRLPKVAW